MQKEVFIPAIILLFFIHFLPLFPYLKYEGHNSLLPIQQDEELLGTLSITVDLDMITGTRKAKDKFIYEALLGNAMDKFGKKVEIRNMVYNEKFKIFNLLVVEAAGDVVRIENISL